MKFKLLESDKSNEASHVDVLKAEFARLSKMEIGAMDDEDLKLVDHISKRQAEIAKTIGKQSESNPIDNFGDKRAKPFKKGDEPSAKEDSVKFKVKEVKVDPEDIEYYGELVNALKKKKTPKSDIIIALQTAGAPKDVIADMTQGLKEEWPIDNFGDKKAKPFKKGDEPSAKKGEEADGSMADLGTVPSDANPSPKFKLKKDSEESKK